MRRGAHGVALGLAVLCAGAPARADLRDLAAMLSGRHTQAGAEVVTLPTRFVYESESFALTVPRPAIPRRCTSVELIGARGLSFHVTTGEDEDAGKVQSAAGALEIVSCDEGPWGRLRVQSDAGRGALEVVVSYSDAPLPPLHEVLPERAPGPSSMTSEPGPAPALPSAIARVDSEDQRAKRDGAAVVTRSTLTASRDGSGSARIDADPGCHRFSLSASEPGARRRGRIDLDAEITSGRDETVLARDRGEAADARLELCLGVQTPLHLVFAGAAPDEPILVSHASWPMPASLPREWSAETRAHLAGAMVAHHLSPPTEAPVLALLGGGGSTPLTVPVEPGACYVAALGLSHGAARGLRLRARVGDNESSEERAPQDGMALVAFCARDQARAQLDVEARGTSLAWTLALFRMTSRVWDRP